MNGRNKITEHPKAIGHAQLRVYILLARWYNVKPNKYIILNFNK